MATHDDRPRRSGGYRADGGYPRGAAPGGRSGGAHHLDEDGQFRADAHRGGGQYDQYDQGRYEQPRYPGTSRYADPRYGDADHDEDARYDDARHDDRYERSSYPNAPGGAAGTGSEPGAGTGTGTGTGTAPYSTAWFGDTQRGDPYQGESRRDAGDDADFFADSRFSSSYAGDAHDVDDMDNVDSRRSTVEDDDHRDYDYYDDEPRPRRWHGGADLGLLVLRLVLGGTFIVHGSQKLFGWFHGPGIDGFSRFLASSGFQQSTLLAWVTGGTEFGAGILLVLGLFTPLAAAGLLGVMANAIVLKWGNGYFAPEGFEYELVLAAMAFTLLFATPGRVALDNGRPWYRRPLISGTIFLIIAAAATVATLVVLR